MDTQEYLKIKADTKTINIIRLSLDMLSKSINLLNCVVIPGDGVVTKDSVH